MKKQTKLFWISEIEKDERKIAKQEKARQKYLEKREARELRKYEQILNRGLKI